MNAANNALNKSFLAVAMGLMALFFAAMLLITCSPLAAQEQEKKTEEKKTEEKTSTAKPDAAADNSTSSTKSSDRAAETRGQARALPATPVDDRSARTAAKSKGDITFDDIKFGIEKDGKFERKMLTEEIQQENRSHPRLHSPRFRIPTDGNQKVRFGSRQSRMLFWTRRSSLRLHHDRDG
jgi:hypothetical protein